MPISEPYSSTLRRRAVQRFVRENKRSPTDAELNQLVFEEEQAYPTVDQVGISGFDLQRPKYKDTSSAAIENTNRVALWDDATTLGTRLDELIQQLEDSHRGFYGTAKRIGRLLDQTESRLDNLLLLNGAADAFVVGVEETFDTQVQVDQSLTDAQVESGYVTLGRTGYTPVDLSKLRLNASSGGTANIVGIAASSPISSLKEDDGTLWEYVVYTKEQQGRVTLIITMELPEATYVGDLRVNGLPVSANKKMTGSCFYSLDGASWTALEPVEQQVTSEMHYQIGLDGVKKVQLTFSKDAADSSTPNKNSFIYVFSLDSIKLYADAFQPSRRSTMICGPYDVIDDQGNPVYFTKATMSACTCEPDDTSVSFYLSQDGENWVGVSHDADSGNFVSFGDGTPTQSSDFVDDSSASGALVESVEGMEDLDFQTEAVVNTYVTSDWVESVPLRSFVVKRNVLTASSADEVLGVATGWIFNEKTQQYQTTLYVDDPSGRYLDLGDTSAYINGSQVSGRVYLPQGYTVFATSDSNWIEVETGLASVDALERADPLYPYNHKYLVEGYPYMDSFSGEEVYQGVDEYFGRLMVYRSPEEFAYAEAGDALYYDMFTIEDGDENWYIKVKVDKTDASWQDEQYSVSWSVQSSETNQLYVKALLSTSDKGQTPRIDSFKVRVI
jgi:hypothetical protein